MEDYKGFKIHKNRHGYWEAHSNKREDFLWNKSLEELKKEIDEEEPWRFLELVFYDSKAK